MDHGALLCIHGLGSTPVRPQRYHSVSMSPCSIVVFTACCESCTQVQVRVYDRGDPDRVTTCSGTIFISRNQYGPVFNESVYRVTISEYHQLLNQVINITAIDRNGVSSLIHFTLEHYL